MRSSAVLGIGLVLAASLCSCGYNKIQGADERVKAAWAEVTNQYQRRADLVPQLVQTVKGAARFERETFEAVTRARSEAAGIKLTPELLNDPAAFQQFEQVQGRLSGALSRLLVVLERYPDLKATQAFRDLQAQLEGTENRIAVARMRYIESVEEYNKLVRFFPSNLTARYILHAEVRPSFAAREGVEQPPEIEF